MYLGAGNTMLPWAASIFGISARRLLQLSTVGMVGFKLAALLLLLCPGLGFRICGAAMKP
jgi:hypothetical protein